MLGKDGSGTGLWREQDGSFGYLVARATSVTYPSAGLSNSRHMQPTSWNPQHLREHVTLT